MTMLKKTEEKYAHVKADGFVVLCGLYTVLLGVYLFDHYSNPTCHAVDAEYQRLVQSEGPDAEPLIVEDKE
jgi:hypothetical protein